MTNCIKEKIIKFKIGDRVCRTKDYVDKSGYDNYFKYINQKGTISHIYDETYIVRWENGSNGSYSRKDLYHTIIL